MIGNQHRAECEHTRGPRKRPHPLNPTLTKLQQPKKNKKTC